MLLTGGCSQGAGWAPAADELSARIPEAPILEVAPVEGPDDGSLPGDETSPPTRREGGPADRIAAVYPDRAETTSPAGTTSPAAAHPIRLVSSLEGPEPPAELAAAILGAYEAFWDSYWEAASHPVNPEHPGIERYSTEPLRSRAVGVLLGRAVEGIALRLPGGHGAARIVQIEGWGRDGAEVLDCFVDTAVLYEVSTGRVRNDEQATVVHLALMRREGGAWRVAEIFEQAIHTGRTDGCTMQANTREAPDRTGTAPAPTPDGDAGGEARGQESAW